MIVAGLWTFGFSPCRCFLIERDLSALPSYYLWCTIRLLLLFLATPSSRYHSDDEIGADRSTISMMYLSRKEERGLLQRGSF